MGETTTNPLAVSPQKVTGRKDTEVRFLKRWHKQGGISDAPATEEISGCGIQKCVVWDHGDHLELRKLVVRPAWQGRGIGSAILRQLQGRGKPIVLFPFSFEGRDKDLERFYRRAGFRPDFFDGQKFVWNP